MKALAVLGASGHGKVVADAALQSGWGVVVFFDDLWPAVSTVGSWDVKGGSRELLQAAAKFEGVVVAIGDSAVRLLKQRELEGAGAVMASITHPRAVVSELASVGAGSVLMAAAVVNPFARLGRCCIVNTAASVDHDCELGDGVHVSPGAHIGGNVRIGEGSWVGIGASVRQGISIGARAIIGAGAAVVDDVADGVTVVGVPARRT